MGPRAGLDRFGKSRPHRDSIPDRQARSTVAIPTELSGPQYFCSFSQISFFQYRCWLVYWGSRVYVACSRVYVASRKRDTLTDVSFIVVVLFCTQVAECFFPHREKFMAH